MRRSKGWQWTAAAAILFVLVASAGFVGTAWGELRTWTDSTGKHKTEAEFLSLKNGQVKLRNAEGKVVTLPLDRLSDEDQEFAAQQAALKPAANSAKAKAAPASKAKTDEVRQIADRFYKDLRTKERQEAQAALTEPGQTVARTGKSPLATLPTPDSSGKAIRVGRVKIDGEQAEVPVQVRSEGATHKTTLHLRREENEWRVFAISAAVGGDEKTFDFEVAQAPPDQKDSLASLVGQKIDIQGLTLNGSPLDTSQFEGKVVLIDFWATWCGPCRAEIPNILANWQQYHGAGFEVIALSVDKDLSALTRFVAQENPPWTVLADHHPLNRTSMAAKFGIRGIPAFILVGKDGKVAAVNCRGQRLGQQLSKLLGDADNRVSLKQDNGFVN